jgi:diguanylate cyclase (GGDEF)-like protein
VLTGGAGPGHPRPRLKPTAITADTLDVTLDARDPSRAARQIAPFAAAAVLAWLAVPVGSAINWPVYAASAGLLALAGLLAALSCRGRLAAAHGQLPASLVFMAAVALLRGSANGVYSGAGALALIPVFYTALYSAQKRHLLIVFAALAIFYFLPIVLVGPPFYPHSQYRAGLLMVAVSSILGLTTQSMISRVRLQAEEAGRRERMLQQVNLAVRALLHSAEPRREACEAARGISGAAAAILFEAAENGDLVGTATAGIEGIDGGAIVVAAGSAHPVGTALATGLPRLVSCDVESCAAGRALWEACGRPASVLYQPVAQGGDADGEIVGVLVVAWPTVVRASGARATVVALLAHEAALAIDRADELTALAGMAQTDALTGLPNRRAWDARITRAASEGQQMTIAMLDLDNFKRFNDTFGHPAGDRLLKETTAAWRDALRPEDLVARLGGEEFGLLLFDCDLAAAVSVTDRLRDLVTHDQTCSLGMAVRHRDEPLDAVMARADRALYNAKAAGRDRACLSV